MTDPLRLAIAVPTYQEAEGLPALVERIRSVVTALDGVTTTLLVIDDNSPDGTGKVAEELAVAHRGPRFSIEVLHRPGKEGLGAAYIDGLSHLLEGDRFDWVLQMDADLSHDPAHLPAFLEAARRAELVVGSRYVPGGATPDWSWYRRLISRSGNLYTRALLGSALTDYTGGYNLYSARLLRSLDLRALRATGYGFLIELKYLASRSARGVVQVPITFMDRRVGQSKIPSSTILTNLLLVPRIRFGSRDRHSPT